MPVSLLIEIDVYDGSVSVEDEEHYFTFSKGMKEYQFIEDSIYFLQQASRKISAGQVFRGHYASGP